VKSVVSAAVFRVPIKTRWADHWQQQACAVMLVIRTSDGEIRWMDVSAGGKTVKQIIFAGERFDVMGVARWREKVCWGAVEPPSCRSFRAAGVLGIESREALRLPWAGSLPAFQAVHSLRTQAAPL
jgi:hypothetical protein